MAANREELIECLNDLIQTCRDGEHGFQTWHNVVERGKNVASIGRPRMTDSIETPQRRYNESIESEDFTER